MAETKVGIKRIKTNDLLICRVCGYINQDEIWGTDGLSPTYVICPCCGVEFGNEDYTLDSIRKYRKHWIEEGAKWFEEGLKPENWDISKQLKNIQIQFI